MDVLRLELMDLVLQVDLPQVETEESSLVQLVPPVVVEELAITAVVVDQAQPTPRLVLVVAVDRAILSLAQLVSVILLVAAQHQEIQPIHIVVQPEMAVLAEQQLPLEQQARTV